MRGATAWNERAGRALPKLTSQRFWRSLQRVAGADALDASSGFEAISVAFSCGVHPDLDDEMLAAGLWRASGLNLRSFVEHAPKAAAVVRTAEGRAVSCALMFEARWAGFSMAFGNGRVALLSVCTHPDFCHQGMAGEALSELGRRLLALEVRGVDLDEVSIGAEGRILPAARSRLPVAVIPRLNGQVDLPSHEVRWRAKETRDTLRSPMPAGQDAPSAIPGPR